MVSHSVVEDAGLLEAIDTASTLDLHRSNLLRLQVAELLEECQLDLENRKWTIETQEYFHFLSKIISQVEIEEKGIRELADKPLSVELGPSKQLCLSIQPIGCTKARLGWTKKSGNAQVLPTFDYMVNIPSEVFSTKDYLHYRYFDKRNTIMNAVAKTLSKQLAQVGIVEYVWMHGSNRPPILRLKPPRKKGPKFQVHLHVGMDDIDWIPKLRLVPNRINTKEVGAKSQFYNHCLLYDVRHKFEDTHLEQLMEHKSCKDTLILLQIWALQRGLWRNHDGWDKNSVALLIVYLLRTNKMNPRMTPIQQFTVVLHTWAITNWLGQKEEVHQKVRAAQGQVIQSHVHEQRNRTVLVLPFDPYGESAAAHSDQLSKRYEKQTKDSPMTPDDPRTLLDAYSSTHHYLLGPVFMDPSMTYNYLGGVSPNFMKLLVWHSRKSLDDLKNTRSAFEVVFMQRARFWQQWDLYFRLPAVTPKSGDDWEFSVRPLLQRLEWGLGDRIYAMRILSNGNGEFMGAGGDSDQFPQEDVASGIKGRKGLMQSPTGTDHIIIGVSINPETSQRLVDRGPPSDHQQDLDHFVGLWGNKAELRRFKDGAIVQAVVWNDDNQVDFRNRAKWNGGYVDKIIHHLIQVHYGTSKVSVCLPSLLSIVDSIATKKNEMLELPDALTAHQQIMSVFENFSDFLRKNSQPPPLGHQQGSALGLPLSIDAVEPLSPSLRYSELFPPTPHPLLGGSTMTGKKISSAIAFDPILVQIRFGPSSKWPTDLKAIGAAKTAMLIQLVNGIEKMADHNFGLVWVCPTYADIGYKGYCFRVIVRADPEIRMLQRLVKPTPAAAQLLRVLTARHLLASRHHSTIHAVHTLYPAAACVVRVAKRWVANHLLSGHITTELIELLVAKIFSGSSVFIQPPTTVGAGFLRFLDLVATFDWAREPLVVDPRGHIADEEYDDIYKAFQECRGKESDGGPSMYVIAPYNRSIDDLNEEQDMETKDVVKSSRWQHSVPSPEWVVLSRAVHLARRSMEHMHRCVSSFDDTDWQAIFHQTPNSFKSYSLLLRVNTDFLSDNETSSTSGNLEVIKGESGTKLSSFSRSMKAIAMGPKALRQKIYRNLEAGNLHGIIPSWRPIHGLVEALQQRYGTFAVFFYNELCPEVIGVVWRPQVFTPIPFSAMSSENSYPVDDRSNGANLLSRNLGDLIREMTQYTRDTITNIRIFDDTCLPSFSKRRKVVHDS